MPIGIRDQNRTTVVLLAAAIAVLLYGGVVAAASGGSGASEDAPTRRGSSLHHAAPPAESSEPQAQSTQGQTEQPPLAQSSANGSPATQSPIAVEVLRLDVAEGTSDGHDVVWVELTVRATDVFAGMIHHSLLLEDDAGGVHPTGVIADDGRTTLAGWYQLSTGDVLTGWQSFPMPSGHVPRAVVVVVDGTTVGRVDLERR